MLIELKVKIDIGRTLALFEWLGARIDFLDCLLLYLGMNTMTITHRMIINAERRID